MTDWLQRYQATKEKKLEELGEFLQTFPSGAQKGGPGSGHWGHAGRPGFVGGSTPGKMGGRGRVNREYFTKGPGRRIVQFLDDAERENVISVMTDLQVQPRYLAGLTSITTTFEPDEECADWDDCWYAGYYRRSDRTIHMDPDYLSGSGWDPEIAGGGVVAGSSTPDAGKHMLAHELGHHIFWGTEWQHSKGYDILREQYHGNFGTEWRYQYEAMGLRKYSLTNRREFMADCWKVYQYGSEKQKAALAGAMGMSHVRTLNDIFGRHIEGGQKGGPGSGHFGHAGRPGKRGGSLPGYRPGGYLRFTDKDKATRWQEGHYGEWADKADWFGLEMIEQYTGESFSVINAYLRGQNEKLGWSSREFEGRERELKRGIDALDKTLEIIKTPEPIVLHRGACPREKCKERYSQLQPGDEFVDLGYTSTSLIDHPKFDYRHVQIEINVPVGTSGLAIPDTASKNRGELEFLLPRGSKFRVKEIATNGKIFISLDLVGRE